MVLLSRESRGWCSRWGRRRSSGRAIHPRFLLLFLPREDGRPRAIVAYLQVVATGQTVAVLRGLTEDTEANGADESDIDHTTVTETGGSEIDINP